MGIKEFFLGLVPASRWEIWALESENTFLQGRMKRIENTLSNWERDRQRDDRKASKIEELEQKRAQMIEYLPKIMESWKIQPELQPAILTFINSNRGEIDKFLDANMPLKCSLEQMLTLAETFRPIIMKSLGQLPQNQTHGW